MGLYEAINQMMREADDKQLQFISLEDIYVHLQNELPQKTSRAILDGFRLAFEGLEDKPSFYRLSRGRLSKVDVAARAIPPKLSSFEEIGKYIPITLSQVIEQIKNDPLLHQSSKEFGFIRDELNLALGTDFPDSSPELRDYEAELTQLRAEYEVLKAEITMLRARKEKPHPNAEKYALVREDVLSAMIAVLFHPEVYIDEKQVQRVKLPGLTISKLVEIVKAALPEQRQLASIVDAKSPLFWSEDGQPPLEESMMIKHLSKAVNRIPD